MGMVTGSRVSPHPHRCLALCDGGKEMEGGRPGDQTCGKLCWANRLRAGTLFLYSLLANDCQPVNVNIAGGPPPLPPPARRCWI